jgi:hypothetical protein
MIQIGILGGKTYSDESDHEEPHGQDPKEQSDNESQCAEHMAIDEAITLQVEVIGKSVCHTDQGKTGEGGWANTDEHGSTVLTIRVSNLH